MTRRVKILLFCFASFAFIGCDRITKDLAKEHLMNHSTHSYFHDIFRLTYAENTGAALNLADDLSKSMSFWLLSILPLIFLIGVAVYTIINSNNLSTMKLFSLSLICSGGIGNIIDRLLFDRHVTDFMNLGIYHFRTGIFNVADMCVTSGVIGLLLFRNKKKKLVANQPA